MLLSSHEPYLSVPGDLNETFIGQKLFVQCKGKGRPTGKTLI